MGHAGLMLLALAAAAQPAADGGASPALRALIAKYEAGFTVEGVKELERLADSGDSSASAAMVEILMSRPPSAGGPDYVRACNYAEKAGRFDSALHNLGTCYYTGNGRPADPTRARALFAQAAELGATTSKCAHGTMMINGEGGPKDVPRGLELCRQAADAGDSVAQAQYGEWLLAGDLLPKDSARAFTYLSRGAEAGLPDAAFLLAKIYWKGDGTAKDMAQARRWWIRAYEGGRADAALYLSLDPIDRIKAAVSAGRKPATDAMVEAEKWLKIAAEKEPDPSLREKAASALASLPRLADGRD